MNEAERKEYEQTRLRVKYNNSWPAEKWISPLQEAMQAKMKKAGFRELEDRWFYSRMLDKKADISFDVSIYKDNPTERVNIEVFDEYYGQHYDFQKFLNKNPHFEFALKIRNAVEMEMARLQELGIISGHIKGEYI